MQFSSSFLQSGKDANQAWVEKGKIKYLLYADDFWLLEDTSRFKIDKMDLVGMHNIVYNIAMVDSQDIVTMLGHICGLRNNHGLELSNGYVSKHVNLCLWKNDGNAVARTILLGSNIVRKN